MAARPTQRRDAFELGHIGVEHGGSAGGHHDLEQAQLGGEVVLGSGVIVKMILGQVGEGGGGDLDAVQAALVEAVGRRLHGEMVDAARRDLGQGAVQGDRVGRGMGKRPTDRLADHPQGAEGRRPAAAVAPDLAGEFGHRGLAAGARDRRHEARLGGVETRRGAGQAAPRIIVGDQRNADFPDPLPGEHGDRAATKRMVDEVGAVGPAAFQGGEQIARLHGPRIGGQAEDLDRAARRGIAGKEFRKQHQVPFLSGRHDRLS